MTSGPSFMENGPEGGPCPPGDYGVVVVGSGPGGLQVAYYLSRLGIDHAVISADPAPGGMFRRFPFFQRLLSWTKPHAQLARDSKEYERYDWNSLVAFESDHRAVMPALMDGSSEFPARAEMEEGIRLFAERTGLRVSYETPWQSTSRDGERYVLHTPSGEYRSRVVIFAVGIAEPLLPDTPGIEHASHYGDTRDAASYADRRLFIIGKQNSGFELASGLLQWASPIILASPRPAQLSVNLHSLGGVRARYLQPWEDAEFGGGVLILDASIERIERHATGLAVHTRRTESGKPFVAEVDEVIAATGFRSPLRDLESIGVTIFGRSGLPTMTNAYESATAPGVYFAGTIMQGVSGLKKYGIPANSGAVQGHRYNARLLVDDVAARFFGLPRPRPAVAPDDVVDVLLTAASTAPELWHQKSYLARALSRDPDGVIRDEGIVSLAEYVDTAGADGGAITVETDDRGDIHPAVYVRRRGRVDVDAVLEGSPLHEYRTVEHRAQLRSLIGDVLD
ncbi:MAG TPA: NAD(P)-binding domain-containing protein [Candidatus Limnocylindrales bacterium]|nr:NAD(P)-binding domain-containing protein [Candidatus Limnocylindrales bacterium]